MKLYVKSNLFGGIFAVSIAMILWIIIPYQIVDISNSRISSQLVPQLLTVLIFVCGVILIVKSFLTEDKKIEIDIKKEVKVILFVIGLIIYTKLMNVIGFIYASILLEIATLAVLKTKKVSYYIIATAIVIAMYFVFKYVLYVPLP